MLNDFLSGVQKERKQQPNETCMQSALNSNFPPTFKLFQPNTVSLNCCTFCCVLFFGWLAFFVALLGRVNKAQQEGGIVKAWGLRVAKSPKSGGNLNDQKQNQN